MSPVTPNLGRVLVVEDEPDLAALITRHLSAIPVETECAADGETGLRRAMGSAWDALVLDVRLPGRDGLEICREVRGANRAVPIMMLTALGSELDRVVGLEMGADDYLIKPFSVAELQARVRALLRRGRLLSEPSLAVESARETLTIAGLRIDRERRRAWCGQCELNLTRREFDLLWHFASNPGIVFSRDDLLESVWGHGHDGYDHTVNSHINRLRGKLKQSDDAGVSVETVWGVGYRFNGRS